MTEKSFALWNSSVAINSLIEHGFLITHCTRSALIRCQGYSKYSCKIYADGAVTVCDAMYHDESLLKVDELVHSIDLLCLRYPHIKKYSPINDSFCSICTSIIQCGGRIFCRGKQNPCNYQSEFNEKEFIKTYIRQTLKGNAKYFINMT